MKNERGDPAPGLFERAFELAQSGEYEFVYQIERRLIVEGFARVDNAFSHAPRMRAELREILKPLRKHQIPVHQSKARLMTTRPKIFHDFRGVALALPSTIEQPHFGAPSFRVEGKIFAQLSTDEATGLVKLPLEIQEWFVEHHPAGCSAEPRWGRFGWTRLALDSIPQGLIPDLLMASWRVVASKKLQTKLKLS